MPVIFEEIDAEISDDQTRAPETSQAKPANSAELADLLRREIALIEARHRRLVAD
jgi:hypothetical protein